MFRPSGASFHEGGVSINPAATVFQKFTSLLFATLDSQRRRLPASHIDYSFSLFARVIVRVVCPVFMSQNLMVASTPPVSRKRSSLVKINPLTSNL